MQDHVPQGYYRHVERQGGKASTPSDEFTALQRARRELAAVRVMCYEGGGQRPEATGGSAEGHQALAGKGIDTNYDSNDGDEENPTSTCRPSRPSTKGALSEQWSHPMLRPRGTPVWPTPDRLDC